MIFDSFTLTHTWISNEKYSDILPTLYCFFFNFVDFTQNSLLYVNKSLNFFLSTLPIFLCFNDIIQVVHPYSSTAITQECSEQYCTSPGGNTPQSTNSTATYLPSRKLYGFLPPITKINQTCRTLLEKQGRTHKWCTPMDPPHMAGQKQDGQLEHTYSSSVRIRDVALKTCQRRWTIGRSGERGSGISVLAARHDDDDECHPPQNCEDYTFNIAPHTLSAIYSNSIVKLF